MAITSIIVWFFPTFQSFFAFSCYQKKIFGRYFVLTQYNAKGIENEYGKVQSQK